MQILQGSIRLLSEEDEDIWLSSGVIFSHSHDGTSGLFAPDAIIPRSPWRKPSVAEYYTICQTDASIKDGCWLQFFSIPQEVITPFQNLGITTLTETNNEIPLILKSEKCQLAVALIVEYINKLPFVRTPIEEKQIGVGVFPPDRPTVTTGREHKLIGLHIDTWGDPRVYYRTEAQTRLCVNLGQEDRYLLFVNLTLQEIYHRLLAIEKVGEEVLQTGYRLERAFFEVYPDYPIVKIRQPPGGVYIAPTENIIHDGCTSGTKHLDVHMAVRGDFIPRIL